MAAQFDAACWCALLIGPEGCPGPPRFLHQVGLFASLFIAAQRRHALLQLTPRGVEGVAQDDIYVFVPCAIRPFHVDDDVVAGQRELYLDVEYLALVMVPVRRIHDHAAGLDAIAERSEVRREFADASLDSRGRLHVPERNVDGDSHDSWALCWVAGRTVSLSNYVPREP